MGAQSFLGDFQGFLGILEGSCFEKFDDSLFVGGNSGDLINDLPDEFNSFGEVSLLGGLLGSVGLFALGFVLGDDVSFVFADGNDGRMGFNHRLIIILIYSIN